jgi:hypothetical protein
MKNERPERDYCTTCGGRVPQDIEAWDKYLTHNGDCPGQPTRDSQGHEVGCGAWTAEAYEEG